MKVFRIPPPEESMSDDDLITFEGDIEVVETEIIDEGVVENDVGEEEE